MHKLIAGRLGRTALTAGILSIGMLSWGIAQAASGPNTGSGAQIHGNVPATVEGMPPTSQVFYAVVNSDGTKARAFPLTITTARTSTGNYVITTKQNVTGCAYVVSLGETGTSGATGAGFANAEGASGVPDGVFVQTLNTAGAATDEPFHLVITC